MSELSESNGAKSKGQRSGVEESLFFQCREKILKNSEISLAKSPAFVLKLYLIKDKEARAIYVYLS
ncbi:hypothetical protein ES703_55173 [subsurface metagenome]